MNFKIKLNNKIWFVKLTINNGRYTEGFEIFHEGGSICENPAMERSCIVDDIACKFVKMIFTSGAYNINFWGALYAIPEITIDLDRCFE